MAKISGNRKDLVMFPLCALFLFLGVITAQATTYYVATTGNDGYAGTIDLPFRTIAKGITTMRAGDRLYIRGGTYAEAINSNNYTMPTGTSWSDAPIISGYPGETVVINSTLNLPHDYIQYISFENLVVDGQNVSEEGISAGSSGAHHIQFKKVEVKNSARIGVFFHYPGHHFVFTGGSVHHIGNKTLYPQNKHYGFYIDSTDNLVEDAEIYNVNHYGIHNYSGYTQPSRNVYRGLRMHHTALLEASEAAIIVAKGDSVLVYNNIFYSNAGHGIMVGGVPTYPTNTGIYNNTFYGGAQMGVWIKPDASDTDLRNNISYGNRAHQIYDEGIKTVNGNNLTTDPLFVDPGKFDFNLQNGSLAIDTGTSLSMVTTDIRKVDRPQGKGFDIGAYEATPNISNVPPDPPLGLRVN